MEINQQPLASEKTETVDVKRLTLIILRRENQDKCAKNNPRFWRVTPGSIPTERQIYLYI